MKGDADALRVIESLSVAQDLRSRVGRRGHVFAQRAYKGYGLTVTFVQPRDMIEPE